MREFFIETSEKLVAVFIILLMIVVIIGGFATMFMPSQSGGGIIQGLILLVLGTLYVFVMGGMLYLGFGIYRNTKRTAELLEQANKK